MKKGFLVKGCALIVNNLYTDYFISELVFDLSLLKEMG